MASIVKRAGFLTIALRYALNQSAKKLGSALNHLGILYYKRNGLKRNFSEAFKWFSRAAEQGNMNAQNKLGVLYKNGEGVEQDIVKAIDFFEKSANQGHVTAQYNLGVFYYNGKDDTQDEIQDKAQKKEMGIKLIIQAARLGLPAAIEALKVLEQ